VGRRGGVEQTDLLILLKVRSAIEATKAQQSIPNPFRANAVAAARIWPGTSGRAGDEANRGRAAQAS